MAGKGLIIGIDYNDRYCQASYFSERHGHPESVSAGTDVMRYLIPSVLCYDPQEQDWVIGSSAVRLAENPDAQVFRDLLRHVQAGTTAFVDGRECTYTRLLAAYFGKLLEFIQIRTAVMSVDTITVTMKHTDRRMRDLMDEVFGILHIPQHKIRLLSAAECFGYYILQEAAQPLQDGAVMFDFGEDGFRVMQMNTRQMRGETLAFIDEYDLSGEFTVSGLASEMLREQMDRKLSNLFRDLTAHTDSTGVYFTGEGFDEQWFNGTLNLISEGHRAFKGNNIYVKGACIAGYLRSRGEPERLLMICGGRTGADISVEARDNGQPVRIVLSAAAQDWYDAGYEGDFILEDERSIVFLVTSVISGNQTPVEVDLSEFPRRPDKTTRVMIRVQYLSESECELTVTDKGFGDFYRDRGTTASVRINLEGYL